MTSEQQKEAVKLLRLAQKILSERWVIDLGEDEINDDEVISADLKIQTFLEVL